jgi:hypothetical protein
MRCCNSLILSIYVYSTGPLWYFINPDPDLADLSSFHIGAIKSLHFLPPLDFGLSDNRLLF